MEQPAPIHHAAEAAGMAPDTLEALLSDGDREDLNTGLLTSDELTAYAKSVATRWLAGAILPDERELANAWLDSRLSTSQPS